MVSHRSRQKTQLTMKQVLQSLKTGEIQLTETPCPNAKAGHLLIRSSASLVSAGTERMLLEFGKANFLDKARQQPDKVKMVIDKIKTDGLMPTIETVRSKLDRPIPMGYCNVGKVMEIGSNISGYSIGDRVASNGHHAEAVCVSNNLSAKIPDNVSDEEAAFTVIGAIALQGLRLAKPTLGETFVVTGLGLIGLITVQLLKAHGCRVIGIDLDKHKLDLAKEFGAETVDGSNGEDPLEIASLYSRSRGVDGVIITASTKSNEPVHQAAQMCRKRGRIILIGVVGLELSRADFYEKELTFQVSCSYGPGRYDPQYEDKNQDYPAGYVRWTEQRNFEAILDMMSEGRLNVKPLISHRIPFDQAEKAYVVLSEKEPSLGILLQYPDHIKTSNDSIRNKTISVQSHQAKWNQQSSNPVIGFIGSGNFALQVLIPAFKETSALFKTLVSNGGPNSAHTGEKFQFQNISTDPDEIFNDEEINTIVIATRHDSHSKFVSQALAAGKHVFVEKPLSIKREDLTKLESEYEEAQLTSPTPILMIGFNRRFSPHATKIKSLLKNTKEPKSIIMTVNAGSIEKGNWVHDPEVGGGRIIGEGCHFIDLLRYLVGSPIISVKTTGMGQTPSDGIREDKVTFTLGFSDGSFGTVHYLSNGHKSFPKERLEVFCGNKILQLDNFINLKGYGWPNFNKMSLRHQDKGHQACVEQFIKTINEGSPSPIPFEEIAEVTRVSFEISENL
jgi:predicted dehydrogenase/threonine dehydrogenase-like Zn-dependent dehydrogenase